MLQIMFMDYVAPHGKIMHYTAIRTQNIPLHSCHLQLQIFRQRRRKKGKELWQKEQGENHYIIVFFFSLPWRQFNSKPVIAVFGPISVSSPFRHLLMLFNFGNLVGRWWAFIYLFLFSVTKSPASQSFSLKIGCYIIWRSYTWNLKRNVSNKLTKYRLTDLENELMVAKENR